MVKIRVVIRFLASCLLSCGSLLAQTPGAASSSAGPSQAPLKIAASQKQPGQAASSSPKVSSTTPVITMHGLCATPASSATPASTPKKTPATKPCNTVVTREQFEKLVDAIPANGQVITPSMRRNLATAYAELVAFAYQAEKEGLDKDAKFLETMRVIRLQTLADFYRSTWTEKLRTPPAQEVSAYYQANLSKYEQVTLSRIFIPAKNPAAQNKDDWDKKASTTANSIRDRAAQGEDMEKLQREAYATLGLTILPPSTAIGGRMKGGLPASDEQELFALKPGEVSKLKQEAAGYTIYKVESHRTLPLEEVKGTISREIFTQKMQSKMKSVTADVDTVLNDDYFGPLNASDTAKPATVPAQSSPK